MPSATIPASAALAATADAGATGAAGLAGADMAASAAPSLMDIVGAGIGTDAGMADSMAAPSLWGALTSGVGSGLDSVGSGISSLFGSSDASAAPGAEGIGASPNMSPLPSVLPSTAPAAADAGGSGSGSFLSNMAANAAKNPLNYALAGGTALSGIQSLLPHKQVNIGQNAANVMATNPNFNNPNLPQYSMQNTASPYQGNWYTYGQSPQTPMYNAMPTLAAHGGLMKYAHGGRVRGYAMGGMPMGAPPPMMPPQAPQMPPQGMPQRPPMQGMPPQAQKPPNPLMLAAAHKIGVAIGQNIKKNRKTPLGAVHGAGGGQDDAIPAKLSDGEYIVPSEAVSQLGDGSSNAGGKKLDQMVHNIRQHKTKNGSKFPPKAKNPLSYVGA